MERNEEEPTIVQTSDKMLSNLRELSVQCRALLHQLSANDGPTDTDGAEARELMASFNIWAANTGVFREGRQSLTSRLKSAPEISELVQQLLVALQRDLEKMLLGMDSKEESSSTSESGDSSDRSSTSSYRQLRVFEDEDAPPPPRSTLWTSVQNTITSLRQLALTVRRAGAQHRQERIQRFKNLDRNKEVYRLFEGYAHQKVDHLFPNASDVLRERMAESIATRRTRFLYLEQHQKKTSTLNEPAPALEQNNATEEEEKSVLPAIEPGQQQAASLEPSVQQSVQQSAQPSVVLSNTVVTKLDPRQLDPAQNKMKRAESVSSVKISTGMFPSIPKLDLGGTSFTCPYCFLVCPAKEASGQSQWMSHLIYDFEPFFCVFDNCSSPFTCADTYAGWLAHMRDTHTQPEWHCWHCKTASSSSGPFSTPAALESHLEKHHREAVTDSLRPTLVKHSMIRDQHALQECPFCGGFPEEIEKDHPNRDSKQAREALEKHVRDHLVSVSLILAPVETGEPGGEVDDSKSEAQRDDDSKRDLDGVGDTYELECRNGSCDCKESNKSPSYYDWEMKDMRAVSFIAQIWQDILDEKTTGEGEDSTLQAFAAKFGLNPSPLRPLPLLASSSPQTSSPSLQARPWNQAYDELKVNDDSTTMSRGTFYDKLSQCEVNLVDSPIHQSSFIPLKCLDNNITKLSITRQLSLSTRLLHRGLADRIVRDGRKIFTILTLISESRAIRQVIQEGLTDEHLPLSKPEDKNSNSLVSKNGGREFKCFASWDKVYVRDFLTWQWAVQAPIFYEFGQHIDIDSKCPLPLITCTEVNDAPGQMYRARIHKDHLKGELGGSQSHLQVSIKDLKTWKIFDKEKKNLEWIQHLKHKHLIRLIATCTKAPTYYIIFPWAHGGNLGQFWKQQDGNRTRELALWSLRQMRGLVGALVALHAGNCRHGDLKPENILHFKGGGDIHSQGATGEGILVISDVGVSWVQNRPTLLRSAPTNTRATTQTYEAPEAHDFKTPRSRRWDLWSMGCMFLEYIVWLLYGYDVMIRFRKSRVSDDLPNIDNGSFYRRTDEDEDPVHLQVRKAFERIREDPCCQDGTALGDVVRQISRDLLVRSEDRADAETLFGKLEEIVRKCEESPGYLRVEFNSKATTGRFLEFL